MSVDRRNRTQTRLTLHEVAALADGAVVGDGETVISAVSSIEEASEGELAFLAHRRYAAAARETGASALLVSADLRHVVPASLPAVVVGDPYRALQVVGEQLAPRASEPASVHRTAVLGRGVRLAEGVSVGPYAVLDDDVDVGAGTVIGAHCVLGRGAVVGDGCRLHPHVVLYEGTEVGRAVTIHAGARVGSDGFGYVEVDGAQAKIPHTGRCVIGDDVEIGANTTIDRGSIGHTRIGNGVKLDNLVHVAHNVSIGEGSLLAAQVGIAGSTRLGRGVWMGGQSGAINQVEIGDGARVVVQTGVTRNVGAGETVSGFPGRPHRDELRQQAMVRRLPTLTRRVSDLEDASASRPGE